MIDITTSVGFWNFLTLCSMVVSQIGLVVSLPYLAGYWTAKDAGRIPRNYKFSKVWKEGWATLLALFVIVGIAWLYLFFNWLFVRFIF